MAKVNKLRRTGQVARCSVVAENRAVNLASDPETPNIQVVQYANVDIGSGTRDVKKRDRFHDYA